MKARNFKSVSIALAFLAFTVIASTAVGQDAVSALEQLRQQRDTELLDLRRTYDQRALREAPKTRAGTIDTESAEYKNLSKEYESKHVKIREQYSAKDPRIPDFTDDANRVPGIRATGSQPGDVWADCDWSAETEEAATQKAEQWKARKHVVVDDGYKARNLSTDEVLWRPGYENDGRLIADTDAFSTLGGKRATGAGGMTDSEGAMTDFEKKFIDAKNKGKMKDMAKSISKAGQKTGRAISEDATGWESLAGKAEFYEQAVKLRRYGDDVTAGIVNLGDPPEESARKISEWVNTAEGEMSHCRKVAIQKSAITRQIRADLAASAARAENSSKNALWNKLWQESNYHGTETTSQSIRSRTASMMQANRAAQNQNLVLRGGAATLPTEAEFIAEARNAGLLEKMGGVKNALKIRQRLMNAVKNMSPEAATIAGIAFVPVACHLYRGDYKSAGVEATVATVGLAAPPAAVVAAVAELSRMLVETGVEVTGNYLIFDSLNTNALNKIYDEQGTINPFIMDDSPFLNSSRTTLAYRFATETDLLKAVDEYLKRVKDWGAWGFTTEGAGSVRDLLVAQMLSDYKRSREMFDYVQDLQGHLVGSGGFMVTPVGAPYSAALECEMIEESIRDDEGVLPVARRAKRTTSGEEASFSLVIKRNFGLRLMKDFTKKSEPLLDAWGRKGEEGRIKWLQDNVTYRPEEGNRPVNLTMRVQGGTGWKITSPDLKIDFTPRKQLLIGTASLPLSNPDPPVDSLLKEVVLKFIPGENSESNLTAGIRMDCVSDDYRAVPQTFTMELKVSLVDRRDEKPSPVEDDKKTPPTETQPAKDKTEAQASVQVERLSAAAKEEVVEKIGFAEAYLEKKSNPKFGQSLTYKASGPGKLDVAYTYHKGKECTLRYGSDHALASMTWSSKDAAVASGWCTLPEMVYLSGNKRVYEEEVTASASIGITKAGEINFVILPEIATAYFYRNTWVDSTYEDTHYHVLGGKGTVRLSFTPSGK